MLKKYVLITAVLFPIIILLFWVAGLQSDISRSEKVIIAVEGYDPRSLISGHYLLLRPVWNKTDCGQFPDQQCPTEVFEKVYRFYLPEEDAQELERLIQKQQPPMQLEFAFRLPEPLVRELYIENSLWKNWLHNRMK